MEHPGPALPRGAKVSECRSTTTVLEENAEAGSTHGAAEEIRPGRDNPVLGCWWENQGESQECLPRNASGGGVWAGRSMPGSSRPPEPVLCGSTQQPHASALGFDV